jgi:hypothetical protein
MRAWRVVRLLLPFVIVLVVVAGVVAVLSARPDQQNAKRSVDRTWSPLSNDLNQRYLLLSAADDKVLALSGPVRDIADSVHSALDGWQAATTRKSVEPQVRAANTLEALGRRLVAAARASDRVTGDQATLKAVEAFAGDAMSADRVRAYNDAVRKYAQERRGPVRSLVASVLGNSDVPAFEPAAA